MHLPKQLAISLVVASSLIAASANARLPDETVGSTTLSLPDDHRSYMVDFEFNNMVSTRVVVIDPDTQKYLGMLPTGHAAPVALSRDRKTIFTADFFFTRYVRGERTDVLTAWDSQTLSPKWELVVSSKRAFTLTERFSLATSADDKFVYIYNFTPSTSVTVVDTTKQEMVNEIATNGCILNYPVGDRRFASLCGDGSLQMITLNDNGEEVDRTRTVFFDPNAVKLVERATVVGEIYYFVTTSGEVVPVDLSGDEPKPLPRWSLVTPEELAEGWAPGGWQLLAAAPALNRLYVLMHPDHEAYKWEDPSQIIWEFDLKTGEKIGTLESPNLIWSLSATSDDKPLLLGANIEGGLEIFDLSTGEHNGTMAGVTKTPTLILNH
ncbi:MULTISPECIES: amine dehydrogenase large subunit [unclassified Marinobacter]|uniref:amine dehydrogenase large subunit n=1 Tax=unclassified Marinobacter TaxID=83889 RepID=UPI00200CE664|nr:MULTISPECIES: amine dehydrogenase large subunit [unclassified Marinobacter]MCL1478389.1 amine dehydrogenase [Marinobacter sp.]MCL1480344.1 amine dehydrogenase [Marinobacter sp.]MCL1483786.1 amine dehydrogenase [Marinobacter sp.]MCL1487362.1 amine dehydrogenase [Marinobacter sp.]UQG58286.1 amine dehydrogenase [Marinobacter sp. M4C]